MNFATLQKSFLAIFKNSESLVHDTHIDEVAEVVPVCKFLSLDDIECKSNEYYDYQISYLDVLYDCFLFCIDPSFTKDEKNEMLRRFYQARDLEWSCKRSVASKIANVMFILNSQGSRSM